MTPTILVCDDSQIMRALVRATLEDASYSVVEAEDGEQALRLARRVVPDVILLDVMMPGRSGLEVLAELRADAELGGVPVIMLTALAQATDREASEQAGADRYLTKPFHIAELATAVEELLEELQEK